MKTFKLKSLEIMENEQEDIVHNKIALLDGLIINREDDEDQWVIEAYTEDSYLSYFEELREKVDLIMLQVKISKESNTSAFFLTSIIGINEIETKMNILFKGRIVDKHEADVENSLKELIKKGYEGEALLIEFKRLMHRG